MAQLTRTDETTQSVNPNRFIIVWVAVTALLSAPLSILSAHGMYFYPLLLAIGLTVGLGQWWLLRPYMKKAWRWAVASGAGWIMGALGVVALPFISDIETLIAENAVVGGISQIGLYVVVFGIMGGVQSVFLPRRRLWIGANLVAGLLFGLALMGACSAGGGTLFLQAIIQETYPDTYCINVGLTLPRLQTGEPFFYWMPLSFVAHIAAWLTYAAVTAFGMNRLLTEPPQA